MEDQTDRIVPLDELDDFEVAEGDPDVRGWEVLAADGRKIGEVDELLVDVAAMKVRYLDVDLDDELSGGAENRHILIPIGYARLDEEDDRVFVDTLNASMLGGIPPYAHEPVTRDYESQLRPHFDSGYAASDLAPESDFYAHDIYDQSRFYGARRPTADEIPDDIPDRTALTEDMYVGPPDGGAASARAADRAREGRDREFGEFGRDVPNDGVSPEDDVDRVHGV